MVATLTFSLTIYVCFTAYEGLSALLGGGIAVLANLYIALKARTSVIRDQLEQPDASVDEMAPAVMMLQRFYQFEVTKVLLTLTMFAIAVFVIQVAILPFTIAYLIAALIVTWLSLLVLDQRTM